MRYLILTFSVLHFTCARKSDGNTSNTASADSLRAIALQDSINAEITKAMRSIDSGMARTKRIFDSTMNTPDSTGKTLQQTIDEIRNDPNAFKFDTVSDTAKYKK